MQCHLSPQKHACSDLEPWGAQSSESSRRNSIRTLIPPWHEDQFVNTSIVISIRGTPYGRSTACEMRFPTSHFVVCPSLVLSVLLPSVESQKRTVRLGQPHTMSYLFFPLFSSYHDTASVHASRARVEADHAHEKDRSMKQEQVGRGHHDSSAV